jgi:hypothetical protein
MSLGKIRLGFVIESGVLNALCTPGLDRDLIFMPVSNVVFCRNLPVVGGVINGGEENLSLYRFVHHKSHIDCSGIELGYLQ